MFDHTLLEQPVFILACTLASLGALLSIATLIFNLRYKHNRLIKMSSPNLNAVINMGALLAYVTCLLFGIGVTNIAWAAVVCQVRVWLLPLSFSLVYGPLFAKSWRVRRIFQQAPAQRVVIRDLRLLAIVVGLLTLDIIVLVLWYSLDPIQSVRITYTTQVQDRGTLLDLNSSSVTCVQCWSVYASLWASGMLAVKVATLLYGLHLAWAVRTVTLVTMNEASCIAGSSLLAVLLASLYQTLSFWLVDYPAAVRACAVLVIWLVTTVTLSLLYIPKIYYWWNNSDDEVVKLSFISSQPLRSPSYLHDTSVSDDVMYDIAPEDDVPPKRRKKRDDKEDFIGLNNFDCGERYKEDHSYDDRQKDSGLDVECSSASLQETDVAGLNDVIHPVYLSNSRNYSNAAMLGPSWSTPSIGQLPYMQQRTSVNIAPCYPGDASNPPQRHYGGCARKARPRRSLGDTELGLDISRQPQQPGLRVREYPTSPCRDGIMGSIVHSLDLDDDSDTYSYISHKLSVPSHNYFANSGYNSDQDSTLQASSYCSTSEESLATLGNDSYYPHFSKVYSNHTKQRRPRNTRQRRRDSRGNVYVIQVPPRTLFPIPSADNADILHDTDGTVV